MSGTFWNRIKAEYINLHIKQAITFMYLYNFFYMLIASGLTKIANTIRCQLIFKVCNY